VQNARALQVLSRVKEKLTGMDFKPNEELNVPDQVDKLLAQATSVENLCQHYIDGAALVGSEVTRPAWKLRPRNCSLMNVTTALMLSCL
jgi:uncharacterized protein YgfB (UPF0149 family)